MRVTHYYFYIYDKDVGLAFIKVCSYLPFEVKVCLNGHEWAKQQLRREGIAFEALENGFAWCADPARLQDICHRLTTETIQAFFDHWVDHLPWPITASERAEGYQHDLSIWQLEGSAPFSMIRIRPYEPDFRRGRGSLQVARNAPYLTIRHVGIGRCINR